MIPRLESLGDPPAVVFEIDAFFGRVRRESRPIQNDEFEVRRELTLTRPRIVAVADTSVDENETLHATNLTSTTSWRSSADIPEHWRM